MLTKNIDIQLYFNSAMLHIVLVIYITTIQKVDATPIKLPQPIFYDSTAEAIAE